MEKDCPFSCEKLASCLLIWTNFCFKRFIVKAVSCICSRLQQMCIFRLHFRQCFIGNIKRSLYVKIRKTDRNNFYCVLLMYSRQHAQMGIICPFIAYLLKLPCNIPINCYKQILYMALCFQD